MQRLIGCFHSLIKVNAAIHVAPSFVLMLRIRNTKQICAIYSKANVFLTLAHMIFIPHYCIQAGVL